LGLSASRRTRVRGDQRTTATYAWSDMLQNSTPSYRCSGCSAWVRTSSRRPLCTRPAAQIHSGFRGPAYRAAELLSRRRAHGEQQRAASLVYTKEELRRALRALGARASLRTGAYSPTRKSAGKGLDMRRRRRPAAHGSVGAVHTLAQPRTLESFQRGWEPLSACPSAQPATSGRAAPHRLLCASAASHPSTPTVALRRTRSSPRCATAGLHAHGSARRQRFITCREHARAGAASPSRAPLSGAQAARPPSY
jgi:hypothetical protein